VLDDDDDDERECREREGERERERVCACTVLDAKQLVYHSKTIHHPKCEDPRAKERERERERALLIRKPTCTQA
jgi:hypothetical protein